MTERLITQYIYVLDTLEKKLAELLSEKQAKQVQSRLEEAYKNAHIEEDPWLPIIRAMLVIQDYPEVAEWLVNQIKTHECEPASTPSGKSHEIRDLFKTMLESPVGKGNSIPDYPIYACPKDPEHEHEYKRSPEEVLICPNHHCKLVSVEELAKRS